MKKTLCILLAALLCASLPALAVQTGPADQELQRVTLLVKAQLDIPDDFEDFYGDSGMENGVTTWSLYWSSGDGRSTSVTCDGEGRIASYYSYDPGLDSYHHTGDYAPRLPGMELEGFRQAAQAFLDRVLGPNEGYILQENSEIGLFTEGNDRYFYGSLTLNGIPSDSGFNIIVRASDLSVMNFYRYGATTARDGGPLPAAPTYDAAAAETQLKDRLILSPEYVPSDDDEKRAVLRYVRLTSDEYLVDALTGEVIFNRGSTASTRYTSYDGMSGEEDSVAQASAKGVTLTDVEIAGAALLKDAMDADALEARARGMAALGVTEDFSLSGIQYNVNRETGKITARLSFRKPLEKAELISVFHAKEVAIPDADVNYSLDKRLVMDAVTGELFSLYTDRPYIYGEYDYTVDLDAAWPIAEAFLAEVCPDKLPEACLTDSSCQESKDYYVPVANYICTRSKDNYLFRGNTLNVSVNTADGTIDSFSYSWTDGLEFEPAEGIITAEEANAAWAALYDVEPFYASFYDTTNRYENLTYLRLCYRLTAKDSYRGIDAHTGEAVPYPKYGASAVEYDDLDDCASPWVLEELAKYGVGYSGGSVRPRDGLTLRDMLLLLRSASYSMAFEAEDADLVRWALNYGISLPRSADLDSTVTRAAFARTLLEMSGYGKAAALRDIFRCDFADADTLADEDYGYIAIARGMGIASSDESMMFRPYEPVTREAAAVMFYNFLVRAI